MPSVFLLGRAFWSVCRAAGPVQWGGTEAGKQKAGPVGPRSLSRPALCCSGSPRTPAPSRGPRKHAGHLAFSREQIHTASEGHSLELSHLLRCLQGCLLLLDQHCWAQRAQADECTYLQFSGAFSWKTQVPGLTLPIPALPTASPLHTRPFPPGPGEDVLTVAHPS